MKYILILIGLFLCLNKPYDQILPKQDNRRVISIQQKELLCLATTIWYEARSESYKAKQAVAKVVLNRVKHKSYPNSICKVVKQRKQFSWYKNTPENHKRFNGVIDDLNHLDYLAYQEAKIIASRMVLTHFRHLPELNNSLYFLTKGYNTVWSKKLKRKAVIGNLEFY